MAYAERLKLNTVRVFLQYAVYERDPKLFLERFESFLSLCGKHEIRMMPVVFDSCFGEFPDLERYRDKDWMACPGQNRLGPDHWPKLEQYVRDVVGGHKDDPRIVMWDVMNEPTCTSFNKPEDQRLIWTFLDHFLDYVRQQQPVQPLTVGVEHSSLIPKVLAKIDVLCFHNYRRDLREDTRQVQALGRQHGKPAIINEVAGRPQQPFSYVMPILREEKIGWCFWELMLGKTQFSRAVFPVPRLDLSRRHLLRRSRGGPGGWRQHRGSPATVPPTSPAQAARGRHDVRGFLDPLDRRRTRQRPAVLRDRRRVHGHLDVRGHGG